MSFSGFRDSAQGVVKNLLQVLSTAKQREKGRKEEDGEKERQREGLGDRGKEEGREG